MKEKTVDCQSDLDALVGEVAEQFSQRLARGEKPSVKEYVERFPEIAEIIEQILPALEVMGKARHTNDSTESRDVDPQRGTIGEYRIVREVGRGGMGVVYEAEQMSLGRRVALKVLPFAAVLDERQVKRFRAESLAAAQLDHPHIVDVYGVGCEQSVHFYSMRFIDGAPLSEVIDHLKQQKSNNADSTVNLKESTIHSWKGQGLYRSITRVGIESAEALDHAHKQGVIHRDIKPANILIDSDGKSWIADFGLARIESGATMTMTGDLIGTLRYLSPEQALAKREYVDHRADIYSLGITLYELLTLQPAFPQDDRHQLLQNIAYLDPKLPRKLNPEIPVDLETIVLKAIAKNPNERYDTAQDLADDLQRYFNHEPIVARRVSRPERAWRWCKRNPTVASLTSVVGLVLVLGLCISLFFAFSEAHAREQETIAKKNAQQQKQTAEDAARIAKERLVQQMESNGIDLMEKGDLSGAMLWFAHGIAESTNSEPAAIARFNGLLEKCWMPILAADADLITSDGKLVVSYSNSNAEEFIYLHETEPVPNNFYFNPNAVVRNAITGKKVSDISFGKRNQDYIFRLSPDNRWAVSTGDSGSAFFVWALNTGKCISPLLRNHEPVPGLASSNTIDFSSDLKYMATSCSKRTIVWETTNWQKQLVIEEAFDAKFTGNNQLIAPTDRGVHVWNSQTKEKRYFSFGEHIEIIGISPDGKKVVASSGRGTDIPSIQLWDIESEKLIAEPKKENGKVYDEILSANAAMSPDGKYFASVEFPDKVVLWSMDGAKMLNDNIQHRGLIRTIDFSPQSDRIVSACEDGTAKIWDLAGNELVSLQHKGAVDSARFTPDGQHVITIGQDIRVWRMPGADKRWQSDPFSDQAEAHNEKPDDVSKENGQLQNEPSVESHVVETEKKETGMANNSVQPKLPDEQGKMTWIGEETIFRNGNESVQLSPNKRWLATVKNTLEFWDRKNKKKIPIKIPIAKNESVYVRFSRDSKLVAVGGENGFEVWSTGNWIKVCENKTLDSIFDLEFLGDEIAVVTPGTLTFVRLMTGKIVGKQLIAREGVGWGSGLRMGRLLASDPKGNLLVAAIGNEFAVAIDMATKKMTMPPIRHLGDINHVAISNDLRLILTASEDRTTSIWNIENGEKHCRPLSHNNGVRYAGFSEDNRFVFTESDDDKGQIWDARSGQPVTLPFESYAYRSYQFDHDVETFTYFNDDVWSFMIPKQDCSIENIVHLAELYACRKLTKNGYLAPLTQEELAKRIKTLRSKSPELFE